MIKVIIIVALLLKCVQKYLKSLEISGTLSMQVPSAMFSEAKHSKGWDEKFKHQWPLEDIQDWTFCDGW